MVTSKCTRLEEDDNVPDDNVRATVTEVRGLRAAAIDTVEPIAVDDENDPCAHLRFSRLHESTEIRWIQRFSNPFLQDSNRSMLATCLQQGWNLPNWTINLWDTHCMTCDFSYRNFGYPRNGICGKCKSAEHTFIAVEKMTKGPSHEANLMHLGGVASTVPIVNAAAPQDPPEVDEPMTAPEAVMADADTQADEENLPNAHYVEAEAAVNIPKITRPPGEMFAMRGDMIDIFADNGYGV